MYVLYEGFVVEVLSSVWSRKPYCLLNVCGTTIFCVWSLLIELLVNCCCKLSSKCILTLQLWYFKCMILCVTGLGNLITRTAGTKPQRARMYSCVISCRIVQYSHKPCSWWSSSSKQLYKT